MCRLATHLTARRTKKQVEVRAAGDTEVGYTPRPPTSSPSGLKASHTPPPCVCVCDKLQPGHPDSDLGHYETTWTPSAPSCPSDGSVFQTGCDDSFKQTGVTRSGLQVPGGT